MCGCGNNSAPAIPLTSGDLGEGDGRFLVRLGDGTTLDFETYSEASAYRKLHGGSLDVRR